MPDSEVSTPVEALADATADVGLATGTGSDGAPEASSTAPTLEQLQQELKRAKGGQAAEQRRAADLQKQLESQQAQMNQMWEWQRQMHQQSQAAPSGPVAGRDGRTKEERDRYKDAVIDGNVSLMEELDGFRDERLRQRTLAEFEERARMAQIATQSATSFQTFIDREAPELKRPGDPIGQEIVTRYRELVTDPAMGWNLGQVVQTASGPQYPTILALAIKDVRAKHAGARVQSTQAAVDEESPAVERSTKPVTRAVGKFDARKHLTEYEREYVRRIKDRQDSSYSHERYWDRLPEAERKRRLSGRMPEQA